MRLGPKKNRNDWTREKRKIEPRKETSDTTIPSFQAALEIGKRLDNIGPANL